MSTALALAAHPRRAAAPLSRAEAIAAHRAGRVALAAGAYDSLLAAAPDDAELHHLRGVIDGEAGDPGRAARRLRRAVELDDAVARYQIDLAIALHAIGRLEEAGEAASRAVALDPQSAAAWSALGAVGVARGDGDAALEALGRAVALDPANAAAQRARGALLRARGRLAEARASFRAAIAAEPRSAAAANELGITYGLSGDPEAAAAWYATAASLDPTFVDPLLNLAELRERRGEHEAAIFHLRRALLVAPESVRARWRLALALLRAGRFAEGWALHEHGIGIAGFRGPARPFALRRARQAPRRALLWGEGDLAAELLFAALVRDLAALGAGGVLECAPPLAALFARSFPGFAVVARRDRPEPATLAEPFDLALPTASLAATLRPDADSFPARGAYLVPDRARAAALRARYAPRGETVIGLALDGVAVAALPSAPGCRFIALDGTARRCAAADPEIDRAADLDARAAQLAALDRVVTGDGPIAHLAGALGVAGDVLLPAAAPWWWFAGRSDSPWYPSLVLHRGSTPAGVADTIAAAAREAAPRQHRSAA